MTRETDSIRKRCLRMKSSFYCFIKNFKDLTHIYIYIYIRGSVNKFPNFFVWALLLIHETLVPFEPIWRVLVSSNRISSWTPSKPQHSNPNPLANQLWCIDFLTPPTPLIIPHRLPAFLESLMPLKNWCSIHARCSKSSLKHSIRLCDIFSKFKTEFYCISLF